MEIKIQYIDFRSLEFLCVAIFLTLVGILSPKWRANGERIWL